MLTLFIGKVMKGSIFQKGFQLLYNEYTCGVLLRAELGKQANALSGQSGGWGLMWGGDLNGKTMRRAGMAEWQPPTQSTVISSQGRQILI